MFALDTNTVIHFFKGKGRIQQRLLEKSPADICIPAVVLYELEVGVALAASSSRRQKELETFVSVITVLPFDVAAAKRAAEVSSTLRKAGIPIGPMDNLIAGTTLAHNATLVTHNVGEFERVRGLTIADWF